MCLFRIVGGKLVPTDPACSTIDEVYAKHGYTMAYACETSPVPMPNPDEEIVLVSDAREPFNYVREGVLVGTAYVDDDPCDIVLFRAINEDEGGKVRIVAVSEQDIAKPGAWKLVEYGSWVQVGEEHVLVRVFASLEDARRELVDNRFVFVPITDVEGWNGVMIHDQNMEFAPITSDHPKVAEMLGIPTGWMDLSDVLMGRSVDDVMREVTNPLSEGHVVRAILTDDGIFLVVAQDDGVNGCKFFAREFSREEASSGNIRL